MKYYIQRQLNEYGPYTLADLQRYIGQGSILLTDLTRSEGMTDWVPLSQVIGNIPLPVLPQPIQSAGPAAYGGGTVYGGESVAAVGSGPVPPDLHWALVLLISVVTCGLFWSAWLIVEAVWIRKIKPDSNAFLFVIFSVAFGYLGALMNGSNRLDPSPPGQLMLLLCVILYLVGVFRMRSDLEEYYNSLEPINLRLSGGMTFFFALFYFQYHFSRICEWKRTGFLPPQGQ